MTYDPYRHPQDPYENPYRVNDPEDNTGMGAALLLGAILVLAIGGFIYFGATGEQPTVANNEFRPPITQPMDSAKDASRPAAPETTGSGASNMDAPAAIEPGDRPSDAPVR